MSKPLCSNADSSVAISRLLEARLQYAEQWGTLDRDTLGFFEGVFREIEGKGKKILEVGSGHGFTCVLLGLLGAREVHGLEVVPAAVEIARQVVRSVDAELPVVFHEGSAANVLPFAEETFDAVLMVEVISHVVIDDLSRLLREAVRILKPGGLLYLQDGNNARSWKRCRQNFEIWRRFELGPPTAPGETVHTHTVGKTYVEIRRELALGAVPSLDEASARQIAENTFGYDAESVRRAARRFKETGERPQAPFRPGVCPIEPLSKTYIEQLIDPMAVRRVLRAAGCVELACRARRRLPGQRFWDAVPGLTLLFANGFTIVVRKERSS